jgi:hypothetical protein
LRFALRRPAARPVSPRGHRPPGGDVPILWTGLPEHRRAQDVRIPGVGRRALARLLTAPADEACPPRPRACLPAEPYPALGETTERLLLRHLRDGRSDLPRRPALDAPSTTTDITRRERRPLPGRQVGIPAPRGR